MWAKAIYARLQQIKAKNLLRMYHWTINSDWRNKYSATKGQAATLLLLVANFFSLVLSDTCEHLFFKALWSSGQWKLTCDGIVGCPCRQCENIICFYHKCWHEACLECLSNLICAKTMVLLFRSCFIIFLDDIRKMLKKKKHLSKENTRMVQLLV